MSWTKILFINILVLTSVLVLVELGAGLGRVLTGKNFLLPFDYEITPHGINSPSHPCNEMKTDVLLGHIPNHNGQCDIKEGSLIGEYVQYDIPTNDKPVVLTLGGSTTSGFYQNISNGDTYPKELAFLARNNYSVLNGGVGAYSSLQELLKFLRDGPRIPNLEMVISLNGINEIQDYHGEDDARSREFPFLTEIQHRMNERQGWIDQRISNFEISFRYVLPNIRSLFEYLRNQQTVTLTQSFFLPFGAAERWEKNVRRLHSLATLENLEYYVFLQPTLGLVGAQSEPLEGSSDADLFSNMGSDYLSEIRSLYEELKKRCSRLSFCIDISDEVPPTGSVYGDPRHHNAEGNKLLARVIWEHLESKTLALE